MNKKLAGAIVATAVAGLFLAGKGRADEKKADAGAKPAEAKVLCEGVNACKGKGECKGADHACGGKNACKGKGVVKLSSADCKAKGGKVAAEKAM